MQQGGKASINYCCYIALEIRQAYFYYSAAV